jgi:hypothetical protein
MFTFQRNPSWPSNEMVATEVAAGGSISVDLAVAAVERQDPAVV